MRSSTFVLHVQAAAAAASASSSSTWWDWRKPAREFFAPYGSDSAQNFFDEVASPPPVAPPPPIPEGVCMGEEIHVLLTGANDAGRLGCVFDSSRHEIECLEMKLEDVTQPCRVRALAAEQNNLPRQS